MGDTMNYRLVPMDKENLSGVAAVERECFAQPWSSHLLEQELDNDGASYIVAVDGNGTVVGYAGLSVVLDEGSVERIAVVDAHRRRGLADAMLDVFVRFGRTMGLRTITLEVRSSNAAAIGLYHKHGFHTAGVRRGYYREPTEDALLMTLILDGAGEESGGEG